MNYFALKLVHRPVKNNPEKFYTALEYTYGNGHKELVFDHRLLYLALALPEAITQSTALANHYGYNSRLSILLHSEPWEIDII